MPQGYNILPNPMASDEVVVQLLLTGGGSAYTWKSRTELDQKERTEHQSEAAKTAERKVGEDTPSNSTVTVSAGADSVNGIGTPPITMTPLVREFSQSLIKEELQCGAANRRRTSPSSAWR
ncbi:hypothetical protein GCG54_00015356 [Colletotrichum gloeosporioides]|uniref:Uncharacterized protein n=1 Tax=Colletotrichum gloeosporioides TaxID=474922 RepID=A0A8H4C842_COLGL|nr:uncharacterized protein GCG54_00015356 [Colletotrichum gloeosporioides]KAF3799164.1 hypothetical protein GCG54_00015356 [Colletotrichum gloeosporioides]